MDEIKAWYVILRHQREVKGWSQKQVARALNTDEKRVSLWECGTSKPDLRNRKKLAKLYNKSLEELGFIVEKAETSDTPCAKPPVPSFAHQEQHSLQTPAVAIIHL